MLNRLRCFEENFHFKYHFSLLRFKSQNCDKNQYFKLYN